jgi:hypothetical protein
MEIALAYSTRRGRAKGIHIYIYIYMYMYNVCKKKQAREAPSAITTTTATSSVPRVRCTGSTHANIPAYADASRECSRPGSEVRVLYIRVGVGVINPDSCCPLTRKLLRYARQDREDGRGGKVWKPVILNLSHGLVRVRQSKFPTPPADACSTRPRPSLLQYSSSANYSLLVPRIIHAYPYIVE